MAGSDVLADRRKDPAGLRGIAAARNLIGMCPWAGGYAAQGSSGAAIRAVESPTWFW
jgi:hypothetical protein